MAEVNHIKRDRKFQDLTGQRFGRLLVIEFSHHNHHPSGGRTSVWKCLCDCGNATTTAAGRLKSGESKSCGCLKHAHAHNFKNLAGQVFGRWTVIALSQIRTNARGKKHSCWQCQCSCGNVASVSGGSLTSGLSVSCGCYKRDMGGKQTITHGMRHTPAYNSWASMISRCENKNHKDFHYYGGRGITVCQRWRNSFVAFHADMGDRPSLKHSIDRINNDGNYEPGNCRWATRYEQASNTRLTKKIEYDGIKDTQSGWSRRLGIKRGIISARLLRGWTEAEALTIKKNGAYHCKASPVR